MGDSHLSDLFRTMVQEWEVCRLDRRVPMRTDFDPAHVPELLSNIAILESLPQADDYRYRLSGTLIDAHLGRNLTSLRLSEISFQNRETPYWKLVADAASSGRPQTGAVLFSGALGHVRMCRVLTLPWQTSTGIQIFVVMDFNPDFGAYGHDI